MQRIGALVTEYGGILGHAAIIAREFGLPGSLALRIQRQRQSPVTGFGSMRTAALLRCYRHKEYS